jgi:imidazolonepropionase-like amidohydrolase
MSRRHSHPPRRVAPPVVALAALAAAFTPVAVVTLAAAPPVFAETVALVGGTVHTVSGATIENGTVIIDAGRITAVGAALAAPAGARVVSVRGRQVYPGFIAAQTVIGLTEISSVKGSVDLAEIGDINPNVRAEVEINPSSEIIPVTRVNGVTSALVVPQGGVISGTSALIHLDGWTWEDMTIRAPVALQVNWPSMTPQRGFFVTLSEDEQKKAREQSLAALRKAFDDARAWWTARDAEGKPGVPRHDADARWDAMGKALKGEIPVMIRASALSQIRAALKFADEEKLPRVILVGADDAWRVSDELKARHIAVIVTGMLGMPQRRSDAYDQNFSLPARLKAAGIPFCIADDGRGFGVPDPSNARNLPYSAAMAAAFGLSREDALKSVTLWPAQILGVADRLGSIEAGRIADLMITDGDPLEVATQIEQVYIAGREIPMETRHTRLFRQFEQKPRGPHARKR